jgi:hypothetical protein
MKIVLITSIILLTGQFAIAQSYGVGQEFYSDSIPEGKLHSQDYWKEKTNELSKENEESPNNPMLMYKLAIAKSHVMSIDLMESIHLLDKAIKIDSTQAKFYAVRGIIKYDWGAYSPDYDIAEGCPDIRKSLEMGLEERLKTNEVIIGILKHPSCN